MSPAGRCLEELSYEAGRGVDQSLARALGACQRVRAGAPRERGRLPDVIAITPLDLRRVPHATGRDPLELG
ncbi:MAG: hypothetical protein ACREJ3_02495, partial [Polyangiaceae bacterium]